MAQFLLLIQGGDDEDRGARLGGQAVELHRGAPGWWWRGRIVGDRANLGVGHRAEGVDHQAR